jgi:hypothetical protein
LLRSAQAAGIGFLQRDQIIGAQYLGDAVQVFMARAERQGVAPGTREVVTVMAGFDTNLDVVR